MKKNIYTYTHAHKYTHTHVYTHTRTHTHTNTRTHTDIYNIYRGISAGAPNVSLLGLNRLREVLQRFRLPQELRWRFIARRYCQSIADTCACIRSSRHMLGARDLRSTASTSARLHCRAPIPTRRHIGTTRRTLLS